MPRKEYNYEEAHSFIRKTLFSIQQIVCMISQKITSDGGTGQHSELRSLSVFETQLQQVFEAHEEIEGIVSPDISDRPPESEVYGRFGLSVLYLKGYFELLAMVEESNSSIDCSAVSGLAEELVESLIDEFESLPAMKQLRAA